MTRGEIFARVISRLQEEPNPRQWTRNEINDYINEGCEEFNKKTWQLRLLVSYTIGLYSNVFPVPANGLDVIGAKFWNGTDEYPLDPRTRAELDDKEGRGWEDDTCTVPSGYFEALVENPPYMGIRDYISLFRIPSSTTVIIAQEDLSAELNGIGELIWLDGSTARGIPVGITDEDVSAINGMQFGQIVGIYERGSTEDALRLEIVKKPKVMVNDGDEPEIREANHNSIVNYTLHKCFDRPGETFNGGLSRYFRGLFDDDRMANKGQPIVRQQRSVKPWGL